MKKLLLTTAGALLSAGLLLYAATAPAESNPGTDTPTEEYPVNFDKATALNPTDSRFTSRYTDFVSLSSSDWGVSRVTTSQTAAQTGTIYNDCTSQAVHAAPGEAVTVTVGYHGGWQMGLVFVDFDNDGQYDWTKPEGTDSQVAVAALNGDMKSFSLYSVSYDNADHFFTTTGASASMVNDYAGSMTLPAFTIPADAASGEYNMRVVVGWSDCGPGGNDAVIANGGAVIDMKLTVGVNPDNDNTYYSVNAGKNATHTSASKNRTVTSVTLTGKYGAQTLAVSQGNPKKLYTWLKNQYLVAEAGEEVSASIGGSIDWMNTYFYIDADNDGAFDWDADAENKCNGDLLSFSNIGGTNSAGGAGGNNQVLPAFSIPADMAPGMYRARFKVDWSCGDAGGNTASGNTIVGNGGCIVDVPLVIVSPDAGELDVLDLPGDGEVPNGTIPADQVDGNTLVLKPNPGYTIGTLVAKAVFTDTKHGNPTDISFPFSGPTIPSEAFISERVSIDASNAFVPIPVYDGYTLVWNDEFNTAKGSHPDMEGTYEVPQKQSSTWNKAISSRPELMEMDGHGNMVMTAKQIEGSSFTNRWETGAIQTAGHFATKYGRIEARLKTAKLSGTFPAFWMMPVDNRAYVVENGEQVMKNGWPYGGEMDIYETVRPGTSAYAAYSTVHGVWSKAPNYSGYGRNRAVDVSVYHIYTLEWDEDELRFYIDKEQNPTPLHTVNRSDATLEGSWPFDKEFYVILNQSIGGDAYYSGGGWPGLPTDGYVYTTDVDWVRVYQKNDLLAPVVTFVDAEGNALAEQPTTLEGGNEYYVKVETASTATLSVAPADAFGFEAVEGSNDVYRLTALAAVEGEGLTVTATYPSGNTGETTVPLTVTESLVRISKEGDEHWYSIKVQNTGNTTPYIARENGASKGVATVTNGALWKFVAREDGMMDVVNCVDGSFMSWDGRSTNGALGVSTTSPTYGWEVVKGYGHDNPSGAAAGHVLIRTGSTGTYGQFNLDGTSVKTYINGSQGFATPSDSQIRPNAEFKLTEETPTKYAVTWPEETTGYTVTVTSDGIAVERGAEIISGRKMEVTIAPTEGYRLTGATIGGQTLGEEALREEGNFFVITTVTGDVAVSATAELKTYTVSWTPDEGEEVHYGVVVKKRDTDEVLTLPAAVEHGTVLNIVITPHEGYKLTGAKIGDEVKTAENLEEDGTFVAVPSVESDMVIREVTAELKKYNVSVIPTEGEEAHYTVTLNIAGGDTELTQPVEVDHGTEIGITIAPEEGYRLTGATVDGRSLGADDLQADGKLVVTKTVTADVAVSNVTVELINREPAVEVQAPITEGVATEVGEGENKEDKPVFYEAPNDNVEHAVITFHHNSEIESVELPAIVTEPVGKGEGEFVVEHDDATIATGELDLENAKLVITRRSKVGSTMLTILWRPTNPVSRADGDIELAKVLVKVITPGNAAPALTNKSGMVTLYLGQSATPMVAVEPAGIANALRYESTNPAVATVDPVTGLVTAVAAGNCEILVTMDGIEGVMLRIPVVAKNATGNPGQGVTGIEAVNADAAEGRAEIYDLAGRHLTRVDAAGIYIVNGIKTVVR